MLESIIRESPLLSGTIAAVVTVLVCLLVSALISGWRNKRNTASVHREPVFDRGRLHRYEADRPRALPPDRGSEIRPRRRFGFGALAVSFLIGLVAGVGGLAISSTGEFGSAFQSLVGLIEARSSDAREAAGTENPTQSGNGTKSDTAVLAPAPPDPQSGNPTAVPSADVKARLAIFAGKLKESLPKDSGPELAMTSVDTTGMTLSLGYTVGRVMPEAEIAEFDAYIMRTVKSLFCGKEAREIRYLNENGVAFHMAYADPRGATVARLTVPPGFCD